MEYEDHAQAVGFGTHVQLHVLELACAFERLNGLCNLCKGQWLVRALAQNCSKLVDVQVGPPGQFHGGHILTFVRFDISKLRRRCWRLSRRLRSSRESDG